MNSTGKRSKRSTKRDGGMCDQKALLAEDVACLCLISNMTPDTAVVYTAYRTLCRGRTRIGNSCAIIMRVANGKAFLVLRAWRSGTLSPKCCRKSAKQPCTSTVLQIFPTFSPSFCNQICIFARVVDSLDVQRRWSLRYPVTIQHYALHIIGSFGL